MITDMYYCITYIHINCQQNRVVDLSKPSTQIYLQKNNRLQKFANFLKIAPFEHASLTGNIHDNLRSIGSLDFDLA